VLLAAWALVFLYAFLRRDRVLQLMAFWIVVTPLPLAFIPIREGGCLTIILFGWAMILSKFASDLITLIGESSILIGQGVKVGTAIIGGAGTDHVRRAPSKRPLGTAAAKMSLPNFRVFATALVALALAAFTQWENSRFGVSRVQFSQKVDHVIGAFHTLNPHPKPGSKILLIDNPFQGGHLAFLAQLFWNDRSLTVYSEAENSLSAEQVAKADYILAVHEYKIDVIREPR